MVRTTIPLFRHRCQRCKKGSEGWPTTLKHPAVCYYCKSYDWNVPKPPIHRCGVCGYEGRSARSVRARCPTCGSMKEYRKVEP